MPSQKVSLSNGSDTIVVDKFTSDPAGSGALGPSGSQTLNIGARAKINNNQGFGWYSGTYQVTVTNENACTASTEVEVIEASGVGR